MIGDKKRKKIQHWMRDLTEEDQEISGDEFDRMMLFHIRTYTKLQLEETVRMRTSLEHVEVILTRMEGMIRDRLGEENYPTPSGQIALMERGL